MEDRFNSKNLIDNYSEEIYHIAIGYLDNEDDAEDVVQEVFVKYINHIKEGKRFTDKEHEKYWIIRVTMNICCNEVNSARKRMNIPLKENLYFTLRIDSESNLKEIINSLKDKYRIVFELFYINDLKISEISEILGISESNVKTRLKRARDKIKEYFEQEEKTEENLY